MASDITYLQQVNDPADHPQPTQIRRAQFVDASGNPITGPAGGSDAPTTIPQGALVPGAGIDLARDNDSGVITASIKDKGVTAGMLADGVIPAPYVLPAAGSALGGVKRAAYIADPAGDTVTKAEFIALRDALVASGAMAAKA